MTPREVLSWNEVETHILENGGVFGELRPWSESFKYGFPMQFVLSWHAKPAMLFDNNFEITEMKEKSFTDDSTWRYLAISGLK